MKAIYIDGTQIHSNTNNTLGYFIKTPIEGLDIPEIRNTTYDRSGEHGSYTPNQLYSGRLITLEGKVFSHISVADFESKRRALQSLCRIEKDDIGVPVFKTLKFTSMDDRDYAVYGFVTDFKMARNGLYSDEFQITFQCEDHGVYAEEVQLSILTPPTGGGVVYPVIYPVIYAAALGGTVIVTNNGTENTYPSLHLLGPLTQPVITNITTGKYMALSLNIAADEAVAINMKDKIITLNDNTPIIQYKSLASEWWWLQPGSNTLLLTTGDIADTGTCIVTWQDNYIGI